MRLSKRFKLVQVSVHRAKGRWERRGEKGTRERDWVREKEIEIGREREDEKETERERRRQTDRN